MDEKVLKEAVSFAIRHIGTGVYSSGKIFAYLANHGCDESVCQAAVKELVNTGYVDDRRAARKVLAARSGKKQESRNYMLQRLLEAGISSEIAEEIASGLDSDVDTCMSLYEANFGTPEEGYSDREDEFIKLAQLRGYGLETSRKAFRLYLDSE
ncbi:MAG: RecX family transcriptional regulator [Clostridiales bacterium]|nr:RecX family transcriptional regulator [Clostridiales bacterium]